MSARLWKETRGLLPLFIGTLFVISVPLLIRRARFGLSSLLPLAVGCTVMAAMAFGNEFQHRTLPLLLSQPVARRVLWRDKMIVVGLAILLSFGLALRLQDAWGSSEAGDMGRLAVLVLIPLCAFCGAPYLTLVTRSSIAGIVFALILPNLIGWLAVLLSSLSPTPATGELEPAVWSRIGVENSGFIAVAVSLAVYCAVCLWRGYARFQKLQVVDGPASEVSLPGDLPRWLQRIQQPMAARLSGPFGMLVRKELGLQHMSFLTAGTFCVVAAAGALLYWLRRDWGAPLLVVEFALYLCAMPFLVGALSIAEERGWGIAEWHLSLPPSAGQQWAAKMLVTLSASLGLGLLLPGGWFFGISALLGKPDFEFPPVLGAFASSVLVCALLTTLSAYAGSFTKSTVPAILLAIALSLGILACFQLVPLFGGDFSILYGTHGEYREYTKPFPPALAGIVTPLTMIGFFQYHAFANWRRAGASPWKMVRQMAWLLFICWMLVCILTFAWAFS